MNAFVASANGSAWKACRLVGTAVAVGLSLLAATPATAQSYPAHTIKLIVPYPPGGGIDPSARIYAQALSEELGQAVVIMNISGASGQIGTESAAHAVHDGYTLLFASVAPNAILPAAYPKLPYSNQDFVPVSLIARADYVLVVNPAVPARNVKELLALAKSDPSKVSSFASSGQLGGPHLAGELLKMLGGIEMVHVPYRGDGPAVTAVMAGEVPLMFGSAPSVLPHVKDGQLRILAITGGDKHMAAIPEVPNIADELPGHEVSQWYGLMAPAGTPQAVVDRLYQASLKVLAITKVKDQFASLGVTPMGTTPAEFGAFVERETAKYKNVIQASKIAIE